MKPYTWSVLSLATLTLAASAALAGEKQETVKGSIQDMRAPAHQLTVKTDSGKEVTFQVDERSRLEQQGRKVALDQFKKGMRVQVTWEPRGGEKRVVALTQAPVSAKEVQQEISNALQAAKSYSFQQKDEYQQKLRQVVDRVDVQINQLQDQAARAGEEAKKKYSEQIDQLRRLRDKTESQIQRVKSATPQAWDDLKSGISSALEDLGKAFEKVGERFR